jgi:hypothetical protein
VYSVSRVEVRGILDLKLVGKFMINLYSKWNAKNFMCAVIQLHKFASKGKENGSIKKVHTKALV